MPEKQNPSEEIDRLPFIERELLKTRTIIISQGIDSNLAKSIFSRLVLLERESKTDPISVIINSQGGNADSGFGIYDMLRFIEPPVITITAGLCASAAIIVFLAGNKDKRLSLPNSRFLIHQPSTSAVGPASDLEITANQILKIRDQFNLIIAAETGRDVKKVTEDANRDFWMTAQEAVKYGLVSKIITKRDELDN
ncbi:MAG: ATP-dependent Clp protease proteolytic subunit [Spirochaetes bacterium]|nr:ATP-dependent Clp protease proteolytic subunit [Spirochaetota bacterium]